MQAHPNRVWLDEFVKGLDEDGKLKAVRLLIKMADEKKLNAKKVFLLLWAVGFRVALSRDLDPEIARILKTRWNDISSLLIGQKREALRGAGALTVIRDALEKRGW